MIFYDHIEDLRPWFDLVSNPDREPLGASTLTFSCPAGSGLDDGTVFLA
jgi:hypothetical protein